MSSPKGREPGELLLGSPKLLLILLILYSLTTAVLLLAWENLHVQLPVEKNPLAVFIVPLVLCYYPMLYLVTGIAAGRHFKRLWFFPLLLTGILVLLGGGFPYTTFHFEPDNLKEWWYTQNYCGTWLIYTGIGLFTSLLSYGVIWSQEIEFHGAWGVLAAAAGIVPLFAGLHLLAWHNFFRVSELLWYGYFLGSSLALGWLAGKRPRSRWYAPAVPAALGWVFYPMPAAYDLFRVIRLPLPWEKLPLLCLAVGVGTMLLRFLVVGRIGKTERK